MVARDAIVATLRSFYAKHRIHVGEFDCPHRLKCKEFATPRPLMKGMEAHVGSLYGEALRIVVVSLDSGNSSEALEDRTQTIEPITPDSAGNQHMYGTALMVQNLIKAERPSAHPMAHVAMLNSAKCAGDDGTMNTVPFSVHYKCRNYLFEELRILKPDLIWLQGRIIRDVVSDHLAPLSKSGSLSAWIPGVDAQRQRLASLVEPIAHEYLYLLDDGERQTTAIVTPHPSDRYGRWALFQRSVMPLVVDVATLLAKAAK